MKAARWLILSVSIAAAGCGSKPTPPGESEGPPIASPWFENVTESRGLTFRQQSGPTTAYFMPQVMGSGVGVLDANNDGRLDLLLLQNAGPESGAGHELFLQSSDGRFRPHPLNGIKAGYGMGVAVGDVDNDGWVDAYLSQFGGGILLHNLANDASGTWLAFEDATKVAGVEHPLWGTSTSFFDFDRDGWLDLAVVNYLDYSPSRSCAPGSGRSDYCHPNQFRGAAMKLFRNRGRDAAGKWLGFVDVSDASGVASKPSSGLGLVCADFSDDGWPDIFVANDARANHLWINRRDGTFQEEGLARGAAYDGAGRPPSNMGVALVAWPGAERFDVFVTHLSEESHTLWRQDVPGRFRDATSAAGLAAPARRGTGFGTIAIDFDHDGHLDLAVVAGRVSRSRVPTARVRADLPEFWREYAEPNQLFQGLPGGTFKDVSPSHPEFTQPADVMRGLAWADLDGDGAIDLIGSSIEGPARLLRNVAPKAGHWLIVRAYDPLLKRDAYGSKVSIRAGGTTRTASANPGQSYCSSGSPFAHFGLGATAIVDEIRIEWPNGERETFPGGPADRMLTLEKGRGRKP